MCGIIGYTGCSPAAGHLLDALRKMEYRGYDSAGIALQCEAGGLFVEKAVGRISELKKALNTRELPKAYSGIGHTRWATHGPPTRENAHPHLAGDGKLALVHNGIIENHAQLRRLLEENGVCFVSQTDTEVLAHWIARHYRGDLRAAVASALRHVEGAYGICVMAVDEPGVLVAARKGSPIAIGVGERETLVASDVGALLRHTRSVIFLDDGDIALISPDGVEISAGENIPVERGVIEIDWDEEAADKGGHPHFMLKEIYEQPEALANALRGRLLPKEGSAKLSGAHLEPVDVLRISRIVLVGCGTSMYAGQVGKYLLEDIAGIPSTVEQAADFRYRNPIIERDTCVIALSQSGETADTLAAVREARRKGATVLGICNVVGSTIAREAARGVYLHAGPEISVASTKAFTCQVAVLAMLSVLCGRTLRLGPDEGRRHIAALASLPDFVRQVIARESSIREIAAHYAEYEHMFFIGRGALFPAALEGALKLKEISYIHAEGYHAAELKHGPIALLSEKVPVVALASAMAEREKIHANIQECRARSAPVLAMASDEDSEMAGLATHVIRLPSAPDILQPILAVVAEQLLAYHIAAFRGCDIDRPRNLAKSVTVE